MTNQDLADFYGVSTQAVGRWSKERKHRKRVQALANAEQPIVDLIADISKLAYIYDCQWLHGDNQLKNCHISRHPSHMGVSLFESGEPHPVREFCVWMDDFNLINNLLYIKEELEECVYGQV